MTPTPTTATAKATATTAAINVDSDDENDVATTTTTPEKNEKHGVKTMQSCAEIARNEEKTTRKHWKTT